MKAYRAVEVLLYSFIVSAVDGGVVNFTSRPFYHRGKNPGTH
jgi:hypothetical protein